MKFLCVFAAVLLAVSCFKIARGPSQPKVVECGDWEGFFDVVYPSYTGPRTIVRSYNYGNGDYNNNEKCTVKFVTENQGVNLRLTFTHFDLEEFYTCSWDSLCVAGSDYCGKSLNDRVLSYSVPANNSFTFVFKTDFSVVKSGFEVIVDVTPVEAADADSNYVDWCYISNEEASPTPIIDPIFPEYPTPAYDPSFNYSNYDNFPYDSNNGDYPEYGNWVLPEK